MALTISRRSSYCRNFATAPYDKGAVPGRSDCLGIFIPVGGSGLALESAHSECLFDLLGFGVGIA